MKKGFTLIELLVVIGIIGMLVAIVIPNFLSARQRASDTKKKEEMIQLKNALRLYYNDFNSYPPSDPGSIGKLNYVQGCFHLDINGKDDGKGTCPCSSSVAFATGAACDSIYMKAFPSSLGSSIYYNSSIVGGVTTYDDFCLGTILDNKSDLEIKNSQDRCRVGCGTVSPTYNSRYWVCAD